MSEEILINVTPMETRVAVVDNGVLQDIHVERNASRGIAGNIYCGKVVRVLPGMQAAFVEIGEQRTAFIHAGDIFPLNGEGLEERSKPVEDIREHLREGQKVIVQVTKDPLGSKGARLTTQLSLPSRYLVYMPRTDHIGVSQRIEDETERERLRYVLQQAWEAREMSGGFILRTAAEGAAEAEIQAELGFLQRLWNAVERRAGDGEEPRMIYEDLPLYLRTIRDLAAPELGKVRIDHRESFQQLVEFCRDFVPQVHDLLEHYVGERPLFDLYGVEEEIGRALGRKVDLKSGGYLIIDQTEAMTTIDVNTGAFVGRRTLEETLFRTNMEAAVALARQLRLRNLGGIIIIDFIDMRDEEHRRQLLRTLEKALSRDHARTTITDVSKLGLVEMTRKRSRESLEHILCATCPVCQGRGVLKTPETVCSEIFRDILREARRYDNETLMLRASEAVVDRLLDQESEQVADLEEFIGKTIRFQVESMYSQEQFDIIPL